MRVKGMKSGWYYWAERNFNGVLLAAVIVFAVVSRMIVGPVRSLGSLGEFC